MGNRTPSNTTSTTITQYPDWMAGPMEDNIGRANQLADQLGQQGYQYYSPEQRLEGLNDLQLGAIGQAGQMAGSWMPALSLAGQSTAASNDLAMQAGSQPMSGWGFGGAQMNAATAGPSALVGAQNFTGANVGAYMNPFHQNVTQATLGNLEQARQAQNMQIADAATKAKAFGGSRHGVVEAQTNAAFAKQAADTLGQMNAQNFGNAQQQINADQNRNLQAQGMNQGAWNQANQFNAGLGQQANLTNAQMAQQAGMFNAGLGQERDLAQRDTALRAAGVLGQNAGQFGNLANLYQSLGINDVNNMMTAGDRLQDEGQAFRDWEYGQFQGAQNFPIDLLNLRMNAVTNTPYQPGQSRTDPVFRNRTAGFAGGAMTGAQFGQNMGMGGWGQLGMALLGGYAGSR